MKKIFQIVLFYSVGISCAFALVWRVNSIDTNTSNSLVKNDNVRYTCNN